MNADMISYYKNRAKEYEKIYDKPERRDDLAEIKRILRQIFLQKEVLEIACGTGYWTEIIAPVAKQILATDINASVIEIAKSKTLLSAKIKFKTADVFELKNDYSHESLFAGFIWSHIKLQELERFIDTIHHLVQRGGTVVFIDNNYVEGSSTAISEKDNNDNTYQIRKLQDGNEYNIVKNFPGKNFIEHQLKNNATEIEFIKLKYYWMVKYKTI